MFKKLVLLVSVLAAMAFSAVAMAAPARNSQEIIAAARAEVPAAAVMYGYKEDAKDGDAELNFRDNDAFLEYEVKVDLVTKKVLEVEIKGSTTIVKTEAEIKQLILEAYPDAQNILVRLDRDGNKAHFDADFTTAKYKVEAKMNPVTGAFAKRELKYY